MTVVENPLLSSFVAYDPWTSFSPGSIGEKENAIVDVDGKFWLDETAWNLGKRAHEILTQELGNPPAIADLLAIREELYAETTDYIETLNAAYDRGVKVWGISGGGTYDYATYFKDADAISRTIFLTRFLDSAGFKEDWCNRRVALSACCLFRLDNAALAELCDGNGLAASLTEAIDCLTLLDQQAMITQAITAHKSAQGKAGATERHAASRNIKALAIKLYTARTWPSVRQAAKKIYPQLLKYIQDNKVAFSFSPDRGEQTVYVWLLAAQKGMRLPADI